jgi:hypothetical protein
MEYTKYTFNINEEIYFKPTDLGIELMVIEKNKYLPEDYHTCFDKEKKKLNKNGMMKIQLWKFMNLFGNLGFQTPKYIDLNIEIEER